MKFGIFIAFAAAASAYRLRFIPYELTQAEADLQEGIETEWDIQTDKFNAMQKENNDLLKDYLSEVNVADTNSKAGHYGRMHAQSDIQQAKVFAKKLHENLLAQSAILKKLVTTPANNGRLNLKTVQSMIAQFMGTAQNLEQNFESI